MIRDPDRRRGLLSDLADGRGCRTVGQGRVFAFKAGPIAGPPVFDHELLGVPGAQFEAQTAEVNGSARLDIETTTEILSWSMFDFAIRSGSVAMASLTPR